MTHLRHSLAAFVLLVGLGTASFGQAGQYTAPGALGLAPERERERMRAAVDEARWRLGPLRLEPWLSLRDVTWVKRQDQEGDLTAGVGAGLRGYVPFGSRLVAAAHVLPEYVWHQRNRDESRVAGRHGVGLFYNANRLAAEASASASDRDLFASSEVNRRAAVDDLTYLARVEVPLSRRLGLFARVSRSELDVTDPAPGAEDLGDLSRRTEALEGGVSWLVGRSLRLSVGAGTTETEFDDSAPDRSNEGDYLTAGIDWNRTKSGATVAMRRNDLRATPGSSFPELTSTTWNGQLRWTPRGSLVVALYGQRQLAYSVESDLETFLDERAGVRISFPVGRHLSPSLFYETGQNSYTNAERTDDVSSWGGSLSLPAVKRLHLTLSGRTTRITGESGPASSFTELGGSLSLSIGADRSGWY